MANDKQNTGTELTTAEQLESLTEKVKQNGEIIEEIMLATINIDSVTTNHISRSR
jgi:hypothetical protein